jgi:2'-5' RNA ligase
MRVFVAVELPEDVREAVYRGTARLRQANRDVRWVPAPNMHLTLKFLGDIDDRRLAPVRKAVAAVAADQAPFDLCLGEVGAFPTLRRPRVVWIGVRGATDALGALAQRLDEQLHDVGFPRESRPYRAHLTLGRPRRPGALIDAPSVTVPDRTFSIDHAVIMESRLSPQGAQYEALEVLPFGGCTG